MGIEWSSNKASGCRLEDRVEISSNQDTRCWQLYLASSSVDNTHVSVFVYNINSSHIKSDKNIVVEQDVLQCAQNNAKFLKRLKHPCVARFIDLSVTTDQVWIITEQLSPLALVIDTLSSTEICSGLHNIVEALDFLHTKAGLCHGNISVESVFVSVNGSWKLGSLELTQEAAVSDILTSHSKSVVMCSFSKDVSGFLSLATYALEYVSQLGDVVTCFLKRVEELVADISCDSKPVFGELLSDDLFRCDFIEIINFVRFITVKTEHEKIKFFIEVAAKLHNLPVHLVGSRLISLLLSRFVLLDDTACQHLLPHLLTPYSGNVRPDVFVDDAVNAIFPQTLFQRYVLPELFKIFHVREVNIRCTLLRHFHRYAAVFDHSTLIDSILPQLLLGVRDANDELVMLSLNALAVLVPILGGDVVIGSNREQIFSQGHHKNVVAAANGAIHSNCSTSKLHFEQRQKRNDELCRTTQQHASTQGPTTSRQCDLDKSIRNKDEGWQGTSNRHTVELEDVYQAKSIIGRCDAMTDSESDTNTLSQQQVRRSLPLEDSSAIDCSLDAIDQSVDEDNTEREKRTSPLRLQSRQRLEEKCETDEWQISEWDTSTVSSPTTHSGSSPTHSGPTLSRQQSTVTTAGQLSNVSVLQTTRHSTVNVSNKLLKSDQQLGAECDVKQIKVKIQSPVTAAEQFDFFADMAPKIELKCETLFGLLTNNKSTAATTQNKSLFAVGNTAAAAGDSDGWDVDFEWNQVT